MIMKKNVFLSWTSLLLFSFPLLFGGESLQGQFLQGESLQIESAPSELEKSLATEREMASKEPIPLSKIAEGFGYMIAQSLEQMGVELDLHHIIQGLQDCAEGKPAPLTEEELFQAISEMQALSFQKQANENLEKATSFLRENGKKEGVVSLEEGKLQYRIEKSGTGALVEPDSSPELLYVGKFLNEKVFGSSKEPEIVPLNETIPGLSKGIIGMREGEKRTLYIHPDLGYGKSGGLPPNSLLAFEIEVIKASTESSEPETDIVAHKEILERALDQPQSGEAKSLLDSSNNLR